MSLTCPMLLRETIPSFVSLAVALSALALVVNPASAADGKLKTGDRIVFLGDSITQFGERPDGYVQLVRKYFKTKHAEMKIDVVGAGISGHKSNQMLARLGRDVLNKKPDWMTLSCGVNDVWHGKRGVSLDDYKVNITKIVDQCQSAGVKVMILTSTMIGEDQGHANNKKLATYNDFLKELAREKKCLLADLNADMQAAIAASEDKKGGKLLTSDGVHMNPDGNKMMATGVLKSFGLSAEQLKKAQGGW